MATVINFVRGCEEEETGSWLAAYLLKRTMYTLPEHIECVDGQGVRVGSRVQPVPEHPDVRFLKGDKAIVTAVCPCGESVELEHSFTQYHHGLGDLVLPEDVGCPLDHEWKCIHLGHKGECRYRCFSCDEWWNDSKSLACKCICSACESESSGDESSEDEGVLV